jgi:uncharacterized membrane protein
MPTNQENINQLLQKLEALLKKQDDFSREINDLRIELNKLKTAEVEQPKPAETIKTEKPETGATVEPSDAKTSAGAQTSPAQPRQKSPLFTTPKALKSPGLKSDIEKFIGENLLNKIGIAITILGVAIGAKYAIDHQMISPLTRIILGYLVGLGLLGFAIRLKKKYENFSAVLLSGSMAILYFITYAAYSFYALIPQGPAFALMVVFTAFTVVAAINYDKQVIAHIGLVGAYAVPFLLSDDSGKVEILFSYTAIINVGILVIAFRKYWKPIYYSAFGLTWLIYYSWFASAYQTSEHFGLGLLFLSLFFTIFYLTFLTYKLLQKEKFNSSDVLLLLLNSFIFYGIGYAILSGHETGEQLLGLFTLGNAVVHSIVSLIIYRQKLADRNLFFLVSGLVLVFLTVAIPVQLDGNWVTLLWAGEAALLFWIGRTQNVPFYEKLAYPLLYLAFFSILHDWAIDYDMYKAGSPETRITPLLNIHFLSSLLFIAAFGFIRFVDSNTSYTEGTQRKPSKVISFSISAILLFVLFYAFRMEIATYWDQLYTDSFLSIDQEGGDYPASYWNYDLRKFKTIWIFNYALLFLSALAFVNFKKIKNRLLGYINLSLIVLTLIVFLTVGLYAMLKLRESYLEQSLAEYYHSGAFNIGIRYVSYVFVALALIASYWYTRQEFMQPKFKMAFDILLHTTALWIASNELINLMDISSSTQPYKLGLSILWGIYALFLIAIGIWKKKAHLRIGAILLFGATLLKLFFYDLTHLNTISKTIVFVSLGILLLIISFLYNKYKHIIADEPEG